MSTATDPGLTIQKTAEGFVAHCARRGLAFSFLVGHGEPTVSRIEQNYLFHTRGSHAPYLLKLAWTDLPLESASLDESQDIDVLTAWHRWAMTHYTSQQAEFRLAREPGALDLPSGKQFLFWTTLGPSAPPGEKDTFTPFTGYAALRNGPEILTYAVQGQGPQWSSDGVGLKAMRIAFSTFFEMPPKTPTQGPRNDALDRMEAAVTVYRHLAGRRRAAFRRGLAESLDGLSDCHWDLGRRDEALSAIDETVKLYREMAQIEAFWRAYLAPALTKRADHRGRIGNHEAALGDLDEALVIFRDQQLGTDGVAQAADLRARNLLALRRDHEALEAIDEALGARRRLAGALGTDQAKRALAICLVTQSQILEALEQIDAALAVLDEVVAIYRGRPQVHPEAFLHELALALRNQAVLQLKAGRPAEALEASDEAVAVGRRVAEIVPEQFDDSLAAALNNRAVALLELGRADDSVTSAAEAAQIWLGLVASDPAGRLPELAASVTLRADGLTQLGLYGEAVDAIEEGLRSLLPFLERTPAALDRKGLLLLQSYLEALSAAHRTPDSDVLERCNAVLEAAGIGPI